MENKINKDIAKYDSDTLQIIYTNKKNRVLSVCPLMHSVMLRRLKPKLGRVVGARPPMGMVNFSE